jgi:hypothetical protein
MDEEKDGAVWEVKESKPIQNGEGVEPQIWFEKDTFLPVRLVYNPQGDGSVPKDSNLYDIKMMNYRFYHEFPFPRSIIVSKKGAGILFEVKLEELQVNSPEGLDSKESHRAASGFTEAGETAASGLKELIQSYYTLFRSS